MKKRRNLVLIGLRGSGKSTVARFLAAALQWPMLDADAELSRQTDRNIREIFMEVGEAGFRQLETALLREWQTLQDHVVALGGGAVAEPTNRPLIKEMGWVVWLTASPAVLWQRVQADPATATQRPPLTADDGATELTTLLARREPWYRECADAVVDTTDLTPEAAARAVLDLFGDRTRAS